MPPERQGESQEAGGRETYTKSFKVIDKKASFRTEHLGFVIFSNHHTKGEMTGIYNILKYIQSGLPLHSLEMCRTEFISSKTYLFGFVILYFVYYFEGVHVCKGGFTHALSCLWRSEDNFCGGFCPFTF